MPYYSLADFVQVLERASELKRVLHPVRSPQVSPSLLEFDDTYWFRFGSIDFSAVSIIEI